MVVLFQVIYRILSSYKRFQVKPFTLHISLLLLIFLYAFAGGLVFNRLESDATVEHHRKEWQTKADCVYNTLEHAKEPLGEPFWPLNVTAEHILRCFRSEPDHRSQWGLVTATLYGFGIVTTLGYNRIAPITLAGRLFCVFYGICGIPMTMIIIANIGQYLNQFAGSTRKNIEAYRERRRPSRATITGDDISDSSIEFMSLGLLIAFLLYVCFGAILLPLLNGELDFFNGIYFNFLCLTAIDFGQLVPSRWAYLPITFLYVCIGLAITTIAIEIGSEYLKKLHHFGKKMKNVAQTRIWFGGKTLRVKDLLHAVGKKCGIDPSEIDKLDLENVVERAVAFNEGRTLPVDTNEDQELPPKEPQPPEEKKQEEEEEPKRPRTPPLKRAAQRFLSGPTTEKVSPLEEAKGGGKNDLRLDMCEFVAIDMEVPEGPAEQALSWMEAPKLVMRPNQQLVEADSAMASPEELAAFEPPKVIVDGEQRVLDTEPRKFKEKKEKYGRDAKKLYETYQEEWDRLERLSDRRLGPRRRSVLALNSAGKGRESSLEGHISPTPSGHSPQPGHSAGHSPQLGHSSGPSPTGQPPSGGEGISSSAGKANSKPVVVSPPPWRRPSNVYSPPPWRKAAEEKQREVSTTRASASPQVLRPPERESRERRSSSPRKLSFTKFSKFGEMVAKPQVPGLEERLEERRKSRISGELPTTPEMSRKSLTPATPGSARRDWQPSTPTFTNRQ